MSNPYKIDWSADLTPGLALLGASIQKRRENERAEENTAIQRMYADAQLWKLSSQEVRDQAEFERKTKAEEAAALEHAADLIPSNPGLAQAYAARYGIDIHPKTADAGATNPLFSAVAPPRIETQTPSDALPGSIDGAEFDPAFSGAPSPEPDDVTAAVQRDLDKQNRLSGADQRDIALGGQFHPTAEDANPPPPKGPGDLSTDELMALALPDRTIEQELAGTQAQPSAGQPQGQTFTPSQAQGATAGGTPALPLLYQAVLGGKTYDLTSELPSTGLGEKYDDLFKRIMSMPGKKNRETAMSQVREMYMKDQHEKAVDARQTGAITATDNRYNAHHLTVEQIQARDKETNRVKLEIARIMASARRDSSGNIVLTPQQHARLAYLTELYDETGSIPAVTAAAAGGPGEKPLPQKAYLPTIKAQEQAAAAGERAGQKREALEATGPGIPEGSVWKSPQIATKGTQIVQRFYRVEERLQALVDHVEKYGERIDVDSQQYKDRIRYAEAAAAALRPYNELSSTDASMRAERAILGPTGAFGHGWTLGANLPGLKDMLREARAQQGVNLQTMLRPGGGSKLAPILGGPRKADAPKTEDDKDAELARKIMGR